MAGPANANNAATHPPTKETVFTVFLSETPLASTFNAPALSYLNRSSTSLGTSVSSGLSQPFSSHSSQFFAQGRP